MKTYAYCLSLLLSVSAYASPIDACSKFIPCGYYEGSGNWFDTNGKDLGTYGEKIEISGVDENTVNIKVSFKEGSNPERQWTSSNMTFQENGSFTFVDVENKLNFGTGFCANQSCTFAFRPVAVKAGEESFTNSFVNVLPFEESKLTRFNTTMIGSQLKDIHFQRSELTKK